MFYEKLTIQGVGKFVHVSSDEKMELLACPNRANQYAYENAHETPNGDGGQSLMGHLQQFLDTIPRNGDQAEGENEDQSTIIKPGSHCWNEPREGCCRS